MLDDSVFAPYVFAGWQAGAQPAALHAIFPRALRQEAVQIRDLGQALTTLNRNPARLRHVTISGDHETIHVWLDENGRLMKVEIPSRHLLAERVGGG